jgi:hypothetical protein
LVFESCPLLEFMDIEDRNQHGSNMPTSCR